MESAGCGCTNGPFLPHARPPLALEGGTVFTFVTDGIDKAYELAQRAAGRRDVALAGGANIARQYLGAGERLFDGVKDLRGLELVRTVAAPNVTHLKFARR